MHEVVHLDEIQKFVQILRSLNLVFFVRKRVKLCQMLSFVNCCLYGNLFIFDHVSNFLYRQRCANIFLFFWLRCWLLIELSLCEFTEQNTPVLIVCEYLHNPDIELLVHNLKVTLTLKVFLEVFHWDHLNWFEMYLVILSYLLAQRLSQWGLHFILFISIAIIFKIKDNMWGVPEKSFKVGTHFQDFHDWFL